MKNTDTKVIRRIAFYAFAVLAASLILYFLMFRASQVGLGLAKTYDVFKPIIFGVIISYVLFPIMQMLENLMIEILQKLKRAPGKKMVAFIHIMCAIISIILAYLIIMALISLLLPEIVSSVERIINSFPYYVRNIRIWINETIASSTFLSGNDAIEHSTESINAILSQLSTWVTEQISPELDTIATSVTASIMNVVGFVYNFFIGTVVAAYILVSRERLLARIRRFIYSLCSVPTANQILHNIRYVDEKFGGFLLGKIMDSIIIALICYVAMSLLNFPYEVLISVVIGVTNVIPFFGPFIGAVPSAFLIFVNNPIQALYFIIFVLILQQFDGNFLGPRILGNSVGVSSFMVLISILIGSGFIGVVGMIVAVPTAAVLSAIVQSFILKRLVQRRLPGDLEAYRHMDRVDPWTRDTVEEPETNEGASFYSNLKRKSGYLRALETPIPIEPWDLTIEDVEKREVQRRAELEVERSFMENERKTPTTEMPKSQGREALRSFFGMNEETNT